MKRIYLIGLILSFLFVLAACGNTNTTNNEGTSLPDSNDGPDSANSGSEETDSENSEEQGEETDKEQEQEPSKEQEEAPDKPKMNLDEATVIEDFAEITVKNTTFGKVINPPNPGSFYSYYENKEADEIYLDTTILVKSLLTNGRSSDEFLNVKIIYDEKYEYNTFSTIEESGGSDFTYTNITRIEPLKTGTLHFLASLPLEAESDGKPLKAIISINGEEYEHVIR